MLHFLNRIEGEKKNTVLKIFTWYLPITCKASITFHIGALEIGPTKPHVLAA